MGKAFLKTIKAFGIIGELWLSFILSLISFILIMSVGGELCGIGKYVDAEIISIVDDIYTKENPDTTFGPYHYYVKYKVNDGEVVLKEPIKRNEILRVGDTFKIFINPKSGMLDSVSIKDMWEDFGYLLLGVLIFLIMLRIFRFCINYLLENGKKEFLYVCKRLILHIASLIFFIMAYFNAVDILDYGPKLIDGTYNWIQTEIVYVEDIDPTGTNPYYQKMSLLYEHNGRWFQHNGTYTDKLNRGVGDNCGLFIDTRTGAVTNDKEDFTIKTISFVVFVIIAYISLWLGKTHIIE